jgi:hypothetical protein
MSVVMESIRIIMGELSLFAGRESSRYNGHVHTIHTHVQGALQSVFVSVIVHDPLTKLRGHQNSGWIRAHTWCRASDASPIDLACKYVRARMFHWR